jgi:hemolysin III
MVKKDIRMEYKQRISDIRQAFRAEKKCVKQAYKDNLHDYYEKTGKLPANPPKRSVLEEVGNSITHGLGALLSILGFLAMIFEADRASEYVGASLYFAGLFIMLTISCLYHAFPYGSKVKRLFRRFDYCCIYLLIGATFAPFLLCSVGGGYGITFLVLQWVVIALGVTLISIFGPNRLRFLHNTLYILLGWSALILIPQILHEHIGFFLFVLLGGVIYSLGIIPFALNKKHTHFIWHFFVLGGAAVQWVGIYVYLYLF